MILDMLDIISDYVYHSPSVIRVIFFTFFFFVFFFVTSAHTPDTYSANKYKLRIKIKCNKRKQRIWWNRLSWRRRSKISVTIAMWNKQVIHPDIRISGRLHVMRLNYWIRFLPVFSYVSRLKRLSIQAWIRVHNFRWIFSFRKIHDRFRWFNFQHNCSIKYGILILVWQRQQQQKWQEPSNRELPNPIRHAINEPTINSMEGDSLWLWPVKKGLQCTLIVIRLVNWKVSV